MSFLSAHFMVIITGTSTFPPTVPSSLCILSCSVLPPSLPFFFSSFSPFFVFFFSPLPLSFPRYLLHPLSPIKMPFWNESPTSSSIDEERPQPRTRGMRWTPPRFVCTINWCANEQVQANCRHGRPDNQNKHYRIGISLNTSTTPHSGSWWSHFTDQNGTWQKRSRLILADVWENRLKDIQKRMKRNHWSPPGRGPV